MDIKWNVKAVLYGIIAVLLVIGGFLVVPRFLGEKAEVVEFSNIERKDIPEKILDVMPKYENEERALACKINNDIFTIVTRGQNKDYGVEIEKIEMSKVDEKSVMKVYSVYKEPKNSHPYIIVKTNLKLLPDRIELITRVQE